MQWPVITAKELYVRRNFCRVQTVHTLGTLLTPLFPTSALTLDRDVVKYELVYVPEGRGSLGLTEMNRDLGRGTVFAASIKYEMSKGIHFLVTNSYDNTAYDGLSWSTYSDRHDEEAFWRTICCNVRILQVDPEDEAAQIPPHLIQEYNEDFWQFLRWFGQLAVMLAVWKSSGSYPAL